MITPEEFKKKMQDIVNVRSYDEEVAHILADGLLCDVLIELGYEDGIEIFESMVKWYA